MTLAKINFAPASLSPQDTLNMVGLDKDLMPEELCALSVDNSISLEIDQWMQRTCHQLEQYCGTNDITQPQAQKHFTTKLEELRLFVSQYLGEFDPLDFFEPPQERSHLLQAAIRRRNEGKTNLHTSISYKLQSDKVSGATFVHETAQMLGDAATFHKEKADKLDWVYRNSKTLDIAADLPESFKVAKLSILWLDVLKLQQLKLQADTHRLCQMIFEDVLASTKRIEQENN